MPTSNSSNNNSNKPRRSTPSRDAIDSDDILDLSFDSNGSVIERSPDDQSGNNNNNNTSNNNMLNQSLPASTAEDLDDALLNISLPASAVTGMDVTIPGAELNTSLPESEVTDEQLAEGRRRARIINLNPRRVRVNNNSSSSNPIAEQQQQQRQQQQRQPQQQHQQQQQQQQFNSSNRKGKGFFFNGEKDLQSYQKSKNIGYSKSITRNADLAEDHLPRLRPMADRVQSSREIIDRSSARIERQQQQEKQEIEKKKKEIEKKEESVLVKERDALRVLQEVEKEKKELHLEKLTLGRARASLKARCEKHKLQTNQKRERIDYAEQQFLEKARNLIADSQATTEFYAKRPLPKDPREFNRCNTDVENALKKIFEAKQLTDQGNEFLGIPVPKKFVPKEIKSNNISDEAIRKWDIVKNQAKKRLRPSTSTEFQGDGNSSSNNNRSSSNSNSSSSNNRATYLPRSDNGAAFPAADIRYRNRQTENDDADADRQANARIRDDDNNDDDENGDDEGA